MPIQVWTTKAFTAQWTAPIDPAKPPITADLSGEPRTTRRPGRDDHEQPAGREVHRTIALFWRGKVVRPPQDFPIGVPKPISFAAAEAADDDAEDLGLTSQRYRAR